MIVTGVDVVTLPVVIAKVCEVAPDGTVTDVGKVAAVLELASETTIPFVPAAELSVTVPVAPWPPVTALGFAETPLSVTAGGLMVSPNVVLAPE